MAPVPRLRQLLVAHLVLGLVPVAGILLPPEWRFLPLIWALPSVSLGQLMLLAFWVAMGEIEGTGAYIGQEG